jgi:hypothetical protein
MPSNIRYLDVQQVQAKKACTNAAYHARTPHTSTRQFKLFKRTAPNAVHSLKPHKLDLITAHTDAAESQR